MSVTLLNDQIQTIQEWLHRQGIEPYVYKDYENVNPNSHVRVVLIAPPTLKIGDKQYRQEDVLFLLLLKKATGEL